MAQASEYQRRKEQARQAAQEWQTEFGNRTHSWAELADAAARFERLGKRYGLTREFKENGII